MANAIVWFRRDLRLSDNPALQAALDAGYTPVPVYVFAPDEDEPWQPGGATRAWLHASLRSLDADLRARGSRLVVRHGGSQRELDALVDATGAEAIFWNRLYEPAAIARDVKLKEHFKARGLLAQSENSALLVEPWTIVTGSGTPYRVFTPFWKNAVQRIDLGGITAAPTALPAPPAVAASVTIDSLSLAPRLGWDAGFWQHWMPGEAGAQELLEAFVDGAINGYKEQRNFPDRTGSSKLSPHLHFGEISPRQIVQRLRSQTWPAKVEPDVVHYVSELGWREFSHHLLFHYPQTAQQNLNEKFDRFRWADTDPGKLAAWQRGRTGIPIVDAGMRELWATGWMHNRVRMIVASVLTKNLRYHWSHGAAWFWDTLVDADLANNTQGWQWTAGTGADAAPYFRIFNPVTQAMKFDGQGSYIRRWVPELAALPVPAIFAPWDHAALAARLAPDYPSAPIVDLQTSRDDALAALSETK
jgi:deoxyribodipyrimidine photo-lyase